MSNISLDIDALKRDIDAIRPVLEALRKHGKALAGVGDVARGEASSFTHDKKLAPVYTKTVDALDSWSKGISGAIESVCTSVENGLESAKSVAIASVGADSDAAAKIKAI
ncbi:MAG: hypothetical protein KDB70_04105 [Mycobacterium sp.]|nr:hypothetical protein [Mycobacterium sp.]